MFVFFKERKKAKQINSNMCASFDRICVPAQGSCRRTVDSIKLSKSPSRWGSRGEAVSLRLDQRCMQVQPNGRAKCHRSTSNTFALTKLVTPPPPPPPPLSLSLSLSLYFMTAQTPIPVCFQNGCSLLSFFFLPSAITVSSISSTKWQHTERKSGIKFPGLGGGGGSSNAGTMFKSKTRLLYCFSYGKLPNAFRMRRMTRGRLAPFLVSAVLNLLKPLSEDIKLGEARTKSCPRTTQLISHLNGTNASEIFRAAWNLRAVYAAPITGRGRRYLHAEQRLINNNVTIRRCALTDFQTRATEKRKCSRCS